MNNLNAFPKIIKFYYTNGVYTKENLEVFLAAGSISLDDYAEITKESNTGNPELDEILNSEVTEVDL